jgi:hypothetical protein
MRILALEIVEGLILLFDFLFVFWMINSSTCFFVCVL